MTYRRRVDGSQRGERAIFVSKASSGPMVGVNGTTSIVGVVSARASASASSRRESSAAGAPPRAAATRREPTRSIVARARFRQSGM